MEISEVREKFINYFSRLGYQFVDASSLIPENDPSVLFTTAGMQQFKPFYQDPLSAPAKSVMSVQPVVRTSDIGEVGDSTHLTMFEMLGNFRFGQESTMKMKQASIKEAWVFIHNELGVARERISATVYGGDRTIKGDTESEGVWQSLGIEAKKMPRADNFWGPTGEEGPCGPTTEIFVDGVEVWNLVFNQYFQDKRGRFTPLEQAGLDTGAGLERLSAVLQGHRSIWSVEPFALWVEQFESSKSYEGKIIIDHLKAACFLISQGIRPSNKGREYILRRLIRKVVFMSKKTALKVDLDTIIEQIAKFYDPVYPMIEPSLIVEVIKAEQVQFEKNVNRAISYLDRWVEQRSVKPEAEEVTKLAFYLFESYGFPKELLLEHLVDLGWEFDPTYFDQLFVGHQEASRKGSDAIFKGGLADNDEQTVKHHTAHHLLLAALRKVLGDDVVQKGSNVTKDRLRIDFSFDRKVTAEELKKVEAIVNEKIKEEIPVEKTEMSKEEALKSGALAEFGAKYGDVVSVYSIGDFSKELCGGPHVKNTSELGTFKILKEEASSQGVRRIKAKLSSS